MDVTNINGVGTHNPQRVDASFRAHTRSVVSTELEQQSRSGNAFTCGSTEVTLTSANESAIFFYQNNEDRDIIINSLAFYMKASTGGTVDHGLFNYYSGLTSISTSNAAFCVSSEVGNTDTPDSILFTGAEAATFTGAGAPFSAPWETTRFHEIALPGVLPKGRAIGLSIVPPAGNTSMIVQVNMRFHLAPLDAL